MFVFLVCLVLTALSADAGGYVQSGLYNNYQGDYAGAYDNYEPRSYSFEYGVSDPHTGDHKSQWESKGKDGVVRGSYSLLESDGSTRIVDYVADDHGFRAIVKKIGVHGHPESIESHGGAVEEPHDFPPIVVAEPESVHLQQPVQVEQELQNTLHLEQPTHVQQPVHVQQPIHVQQPVHVPETPAYHSYDGGIEDYQNVYNEQPYHFQVPKAEEIYVGAPEHNFGYLQQPHAVPKQIYLEQPHVSNQDIYFQQPYPIHRDQSYGHQPQFLPNQEVYATQSYDAPREQIHLQQGLLPPKADGYYTEHNQYAQPIGNGAVAYHQPQQYVPQEQIAAVEQHHQVPIQGKLAETYQNHQQYPASKENSGGPYQVTLPIQSYQLEQSFPGGNQVLLDTSGQFGGQHESSQNYYGRTGNLHDDSEYTNYGNTGDLILNQGEYVPQASHYRTPELLPLQNEHGQQIIHK